MLENEGSAPPQEPGKVARNVLGLVLDTSDIAPQPGKCVPLILRKPDERRRATQLWKFTDVSICYLTVYKNMLINNG